MRALLATSGVFALLVAAMAATAGAGLIAYEGFETYAAGTSRTTYAADTYHFDEIKIVDSWSGAIPEPATLALMGLGVLGIYLGRRLR